MTSDASADSGIVFVQSRIKSTDVLSPQVFKKWYEEVHIRDLLQTSGVKSALRYVQVDTPEDELNQGEGFPYLALYPRVELPWMRSPGCEFFKVPLHNDMLPEPSRFIFDFGEFKMASYKFQLAVNRREGLVETEPPKHIVVAKVNTASTAAEAFTEAGVEFKGPQPDAVFVYEFDCLPHFVPPRDPDESKTGPLFLRSDYVILYLLDELPTVEGFKGESPLVYKLISAFGDTNTKLW